MDNTITVYAQAYQQSLNGVHLYFYLNEREIAYGSYWPENDRLHLNFSIRVSDKAYMDMQTPRYYVKETHKLYPDTVGLSQEDMLPIVRKVSSMALTKRKEEQFLNDYRRIYGAEAKSLI